TATPTGADQISWPVIASRATHTSRGAPSRSRVTTVNALPSAIVKELNPFLIWILQRTLGPPAGQFRFGISLQNPSPFGPRYGGQSPALDNHAGRINSQISAQTLFIRNVVFWTVRQSLYSQTIKNRTQFEVPFFIHENITFHYLEKGTGIAFLFQHGLGGDVEAVFALIQPPSGFRLIGMDFRGHGKTSPLGEVEKIAFDCFADDLIALMDHLGIQSGIIGGTSMGGGVALNCALRYPNRVLGLVLQRPAWLDGPRPENVTI